MESSRKETLYELWSAVYNAEHDIDGCYSIKMFGDEFPQIDELHSKIIPLLREYLETLDSVVNAKKPYEIEE